MNWGPRKLTAVTGGNVSEAAKLTVAHKEQPRQKFQKIEKISKASGLSVSEGASQKSVPVTL
jgi:hypothetical protein